MTCLLKLCCRLSHQLIWDIYIHFIWDYYSVCYMWVGKSLSMHTSLSTWLPFHILLPRFYYIIVVLTSYNYSNTSHSLSVVQHPLYYMSGRGTVVTFYQQVSQYEIYEANFLITKSSVWPQLLKRCPGKHFIVQTLLISQHLLGC